MLLEILKAILFGIVEGITEWLPISSTGHMILLDQVVKLNVSADFYKMFQVVIQLGAIMAVVILFWNKLWPFYMKETDGGKKAAWKDGALAMWIKIIIACIPAAIVGVLSSNPCCYCTYRCRNSFYSCGECKERQQTSNQKYR